MAFTDVFTASFGQASEKRRLSVQLSADGVHWPGRRDELRCVDLVPLPLFAHIAADQGCNLLILCAAAQHLLQVRLLQREQTVPQFAVSREPYAVAVQAEWP